MKLCETFVSFCGEVNVGRFAMFIRLAGCNLNCSWCFGVRPGRYIPKIVLSEKQNKEIINVEKGDKLLTLDSQRNLVETTVKEVTKRDVDEWYQIVINDRVYFVTPEHRFFTKNSIKRADELKIDDEIYNMKSTEKLYFRAKKYNYIFAKNDINYQNVNRKTYNIIIRKNNKIIASDNASIVEDFSTIENNGAKVQSTKYFNRDSKRYSVSTRPLPLTVYNLSCAPYNTYLIDNMWVHNCDTPYAKEQEVEIDVKEMILQGKHFPRVVITGGEPFLQKIEVCKLVEGLTKANPFIKIEIETNGTITPMGIGKYNNVIYNVSPKLKNSGNPYEKRIIPSTINWFNQIGANWKFVVENENDVDEVNSFIANHGIKKSEVFLMPQGKTKEEQIELMPEIIKWCKYYGFNFSPRFQVLLWGNKRGA